MEEPSVLDYVKSLLLFWKGPPLAIPEEKDSGISEEQIPELSREEPIIVGSGKDLKVYPEQEPTSVAAAHPQPLPWKIFASIILAAAGQWILSPALRSPVIGTLLLIASIGLAGWAYLSKEWQPPEPNQYKMQQDPRRIDLVFLSIGLAFGMLTLFASGGNRFGFVNLTTLLFSVFFTLKAFWIKNPSNNSVPTRWIASIRSRDWKLSISPWVLLLASAIILTVYFRTAKLDIVPPEMVSDHAEKYLDVFDILDGNYHIFFPRNGGREALQFYLLTAMIVIFNAPISFLTLKISTTIIGLLALPFIFLLGNEIGDRRLGLIALLFAGTSYWLNVISRAGMRLPFYVLFTAAVLYFLIRGLRTGNRNDFLFCGLALGLGMYGYSADRILPVVVAVTVLLFILHRESSGKRPQVFLQTVMLYFIALIVSLPLLRYSIQDPAGFGGRMWSRMSAGTSNQPLEIAQIFLMNTWKALTMFSWSDGNVWVTSIPDYPALGIAAGTLFYTGVALILARYIKQRSWLDLFLIISIPLLMLPSILSIGFPTENPNLYRTGGTAVLVFLIAGISLSALMISFEDRITAPWGTRFAWSIFALFILISAFQNHDLVFNKYFQQYRLSAQNTQEMGKVIRGFVDAGGSPQGVWVMGFPHWADTRLVAINAGYPRANLALFSDQIVDTLETDSPKLFIVHLEDKTSQDTLLKFYGNGWFHRYNAAVDGKDFMIFTVPHTDSEN